ncbi:MAG: TrmH family RNA methyltransferase [Candidatus Yanofskybacteria bacterium]|nr:TrmH family RNA methyltransferase [Candidatus Yanofskybacteria bacterium]
MPKQELYLILNNIRSAYNIGSIFRTADGVGISKIYLCGISPTPEVNDNPSSLRSSGSSSKLSKTALGAEKTVPWEYHKQALRLIKKLKNQNSNLKIIGLEQTNKSMNVFKFKPQFPLALIVGNEVHGLNKKILSYADKIIEIPMYGKKESLNVAVATGIALYKLLEKQNASRD